MSKTEHVAIDGACSCRFEAETAADVRDANEIAAVPFGWTVAAGPGNNTAFG